MNHDHRDEDRDAGRDLVGDHLGGGAHPAEERPLGVGGPPRDQDPDHHQGGDRGDVEQAHVEIGHGHAVPEGQDHEGQGEAGEDEVGRGAEEERIGLAGDQVLLEEELDRVGDPHQEAAQPLAVGPDAALHPAGDAPLPPHDHAREDGGEVEEQERDHEQHGRGADVVGPRPREIGPQEVPEPAQRGVDARRVVERGREQDQDREEEGDGHHERQGEGDDPPGRAPGSIGLRGHQRSISGATTSSEAIRATRSATIRPGERSSMMPMAR